MPILGPIPKCWWPIIFGGTNCLIRSGEPKNATFERTGDVVTTGGTFGPNEPITLGGKYYHHGQITETIPAYDISPIVRPTAPDVYDTCSSQPNPDKHGLNWEFSDPKNGWVRDILDGRADGVEILESIPVTGVGWIRNGDGTYSYDGTDGAFALNQFDNSLSVSSRYEVYLSIIEKTGPDESGFSLSGGVPTGMTSTTAPFDVRKRFTATDTFCRIYARNTDTVTMTAEIRALLPATGTLNLKGLSVVPAVTEWQTVGDFNILSGATGNQILYIESGTGLICATDGTNTCKSHTAYTEGTDHLVSLVFGDGQMQLIMDGVKGGLCPFVGTFTPGETLKWGLNNEDIFSKGDVCGSTAASFDDAVELAQDLAFTL